MATSLSEAATRYHILREELTQPYLGPVDARRIKREQRALITEHGVSLMTHVLSVEEAAKEYTKLGTKLYSRGVSPRVRQESKQARKDILAAFGYAIRDISAPVTESKKSFVTVQKPPAPGVKVLVFGPKMTVVQERSAPASLGAGGSLTRAEVGRLLRDLADEIDP
jgi:hypothetical protein